MKLVAMDELERSENKISICLTNYVGEIYTNVFQFKCVRFISGTERKSMQGRTEHVEYDGDVPHNAAVRLH